MSTDGKAFVHSLSPETYEGIAKLGRKLNFKPLIDYCNDNGYVRIYHAGKCYEIDPNGKCTVSASIDKPFDLELVPTNPSGE
jgi:hypothetical protein